MPANDSDEFLSDGHVGSVRSVVADSWRRSELWGLQPARVERRFYEVDTDSKFLHQVRPALERLSDRLGGTDTSVVVADPRGRIVWQWAENAGHQRMLERHLVVVGSDHSEEQIGTNGIGTALEINRSVAIVGEEHFAHAMRNFACHAATVRHPLTRRVVGVANITSSARNSSPLLNSILLGALDDMERLLLEGSSPAEHELLTRFLLARRRARRPVVTVGEDFLVANESAMRLGISQEWLWQEVRASGTSERAEFTVPGREHMRASAQIVRNSSTIVGAVVTLRDDGEPAAVASRRPGRPGSPGPDLLRDANRLATERRRLLVTGEPGVGKRSLVLDVARAAGEDVTTIDAALATVDGAPLWLKRLRKLLDAGSGAVVILHLDGLAQDALTSLTAVLDEDRAGTPMVLATASAAVPPAVLSSFGTSSVELTPLRERTAEIPALVARMCEIHAPDRTVRASTAALEALQEYDWPGNLRQLDEVVREVVESTPAPVIGTADLPRQLRHGSRRSLSPLEAAEAAVIARVLDESGWNKKLAAQRLQIARGSLYQKMRRYRIVGP